jgi:formamidopyrimidine-DNA glycosylase
MPELPDVTLYVERLAPLVVGQTLQRVRLASPFLLRSVEPPLTSAAGRRVTGVRRLGKRIVLSLDGNLFLVLHLMVAGRLRWRPAGAAVPGRNGLAAFDFADAGTLLLTEASSKKRASLALLRGEAALAALDPGGLEVLEADLASFRAALAGESHTLKRTLTDPSIFSASATPTPTRSCTARACRLSSARPSSTRRRASASTAPPATPSRSGSSASAATPRASPRR